MKTISPCISLIVLFCVTNVFGVENKYIQGTFYQNARLNESKTKKLKAFVDRIAAKTTDDSKRDLLHRFTRKECA